MRILDLSTVGAFDGEFDGLGVMCACHEGVLVDSCEAG